MRIVFSRKGFDTATGGGTSPIVEGRPVSLPIPNRSGPAATTYGELDLADLVAQASRGRLGADDLCHHDPMFLAGGTCLFGQCGAAQSHLANRGVGIGDLFVFFGLFRADGEAAHHRIFGYLRVEEVVELASCAPARRAELAALRHPHALGMHGANDAIYAGPGRTALAAHPDLRLTVPGANASEWRVPGWLRETGLSYHGNPARWLNGDRLRSVGRGQEFVTDIGERQAPREWAERVIGLIEHG